MLEVEEEEGIAVVLIHCTAWRCDGHGIGSTELDPVVAFYGELMKKHREGTRERKRAVAEGGRE